MKNLMIAVLAFILVNANSQNEKKILRNYQLDEILTPFRVPFPSDPVKYIDFDNDTDPDAIMSVINGRNALWIDDDDDMRVGDIEGDTDNDCLMIDINDDGKYGSELDLIVDYIDTNNDQKADWQMIVDNGKKDETGKWLSHYIWFEDIDQDGIFGYINWHSMKFEGWDHDGRANFYTDYNGKSLMLKVHITSWNIENPEYSWENPFLYFDPDGDGLTEMAMRMVDEPSEIISVFDPLVTWKFSKYISMVQITFDLDNDNSSGNELDFDMSLKFKGNGFSYKDQMHSLGNYPVEFQADKYFDDPRIRHLKNLVYPAHDTAYALTFKNKNWDYCWFVFDEDDDCQRWERVEFYDPLDPFTIGAKKGGLDNNPQADASGDRGEWDMDFSGQGNLYISPLDGKIHLYGAETGYWRIDQQSLYYQGWQGWRGENLQPEDFENIEPEKFATIKYEDTDNNGFFDKISFDMNGDELYEMNISLFDTMLPDTSKIYETSSMQYEDYVELFHHVANESFDKSMKYLTNANIYNLNSNYYSFLKNPLSTHEKYSYGFWLKFYLLNDLIKLSEYRNDEKIKSEALKAYLKN